MNSCRPFHMVPQVAHLRGEDVGLE